MKSRIVSIALIAIFLVVPATLANATEAQQACDQGRTLLAKGNFSDALAHFKRAAKADPENKDYFAECVILQRVMQLREELNNGVDDEKCQKIGAALYNYYKQNHVRDEAVKLASMMYDKFGCGDSAAMLADAQLELDQNKAAAKTLGGLCKSKCTPRTKALYGVALARLGELDQAQRLAHELEPADDWSPETCYDAARLYALVGEKDQACKALACSFEHTPPPHLSAAKDHARTCSDLKSLTESDAFVAALKTQSKITGCGGCSKSCGSDKSSGCSEAKSDASCKEKAAKHKCDHDK